MAQERATPEEIHKSVVEHRAGEGTLEDDGGATASGRRDPAEHRPPEGWSPNESQQEIKPQWASTFPDNEPQTDNPEAHPGGVVGPNSEGAKMKRGESPSPYRTTADN